MLAALEEANQVIIEREPASLMGTTVTGLVNCTGEVGFEGEHLLGCGQPDHVLAVTHLTRPAAHS